MAILILVKFFFFAFWVFLVSGFYVLTFCVVVILHFGVWSSSLDSAFWVFCVFGQSKMACCVLRCVTYFCIALRCMHLCWLLESFYILILICINSFQTFLKHLIRNVGFWSDCSWQDGPNAIYNH
jgi:hypothetical protein